MITACSFLRFLLFRAVVTAQTKKYFVWSQRAVFNFTLRDGCQSGHQSTWRSGIDLGLQLLIVLTNSDSDSVDSFLNIATSGHPISISDVNLSLLVQTAPCRRTDIDTGNGVCAYP